MSFICSSVGRFTLLMDTSALGAAAPAVILVDEADVAGGWAAAAEGIGLILGTTADDCCGAGSWGAARCDGSGRAGACRAGACDPRVMRTDPSPSASTSALPAPTSSGPNCRAIRPRSSTAIRVATSSTRSRFCSTITIASLASAFSRERICPDLMHDRGLHAFGGFVEQNDPRVGHQRARQRQHLLLAAGQRPAAPVEQRRETREQSHAALDRFLLRLVRIAGPREAQIVERGKARQDASSLRHVGQTAPAARVCRLARDVGPVERDMATGGWQQTHQSLQQRGLAHAVVADDAQRFAFRRAGSSRRAAQGHAHTPSARRAPRAGSGPWLRSARPRATPTTWQWSPRLHAARFPM